MMVDGRESNPNPSASTDTTPGAEDVFGIGRAIGDILHDFRLVAKIGEGGMGLVYKARQLSLDQDVALKILPPHLAENRDFVQRFYREARMSVKLNNANIVHGVAVGFACATCGYNGRPEEHPAHPAGTPQERGLHYFAMEFVEGQDLDHWLKRLGHLSIADAVKITIEIARALDYAHARKPPIFHRDVKPGNIMVTPDGEVKLADLGLAKAGEDDSGLTQVGEMAGTVGYMPPEQARNAALVDGRSDLYALGTTLYVLLTGKKPFTGNNPQDIIESKERGVFAPARSVNPQVPDALDRIIAKTLAPSVSARFQTGGELAGALEHTGLAATHLSFLDADATATAPALTAIQAAPSRAGRRRWLLSALATASILVTVTSGYLIWSRPSADTTSKTAVPGAQTKTVPHLPPPAPAAVVRNDAAAKVEPVDMVLARAIGHVTTNQISEARRTLTAGLAAYPDETQLARPLRELERGALVLFQYQTPEETSPVQPLWLADGVTLTRRDNYRFGMVAARDCYVYAYQRDTQPSVTRIFPNPRYSPQGNPLPAGTALWLPEFPQNTGTAWLHLDASIGEEQVYFVAVTAPLRDPDGFGDILLADADRLTTALRQGLRAFLQDSTPPGEPCFVEDVSAVQVFRFSHK